MKLISIEKELLDRCPGIKLVCIEADVKVHESGEQLRNEMAVAIESISQLLTTDHISGLPAISSSRNAYKACGKDPARYRLSAEALLRRVVSGKGLYHINNVVDQLNLVSIVSGFSIGGYDADKIKGVVRMGIGREGEPYNGIGRGELNIAGLPVFRDDEGAFGTPTSDSERTMVTEKTTRFLMIIIDFGSKGGLENAFIEASRLLREYCSAENIVTTNIS